MCQINLHLPRGCRGLLTNDFKQSELVILCLQCNCKIGLNFLQQLSSSQHSSSPQNGPKKPIVREKFDKNCCVLKNSLIYILLDF